MDRYPHSSLCNISKKRSEIDTMCSSMTKQLGFSHSRHSQHQSFVKDNCLTLGTPCVSLSFMCKRMKNKEFRFDAPFSIVRMKRLLSAQVLKKSWLTTSFLLGSRIYDMIAKAWSIKMLISNTQFPPQPSEELVSGCWWCIEASYSFSSVHKRWMRGTKMCWAPTTCQVLSISHVLLRVFLIKIRAFNAMKGERVRGARGVVCRWPESNGHYIILLQ